MVPSGNISLIPAPWGGGQQSRSHFGRDIETCVYLSTARLYRATLLGVQVWVGEVIEDNGFDGIPRTISMTWNGCDLEVKRLAVY